MGSVKWGFFSFVYIFACVSSKIAILIQLRMYVYIHNICKYLCNMGMYMGKIEQFRCVPTQSTVQILKLKLKLKNKED